MTPLPFTRTYLEAVLIARVVLDPTIAARFDVECLSPAAATLFDGVLDEPTAAQYCLLATVEPSGNADADRFVVKLARRVEALTLPEITFHPRDTLVALINSLPRLGASSHGDRAA